MRRGIQIFTKPTGENFTEKGDDRTRQWVTIPKREDFIRGLNTLNQMANAGSTDPPLYPGVPVAVQNTSGFDIPVPDGGWLVTSFITAQALLKGLGVLNFDVDYHSYDDGDGYGENVVAGINKPPSGKKQTPSGGRLPALQVLIMLQVQLREIGSYVTINLANQLAGYISLIMRNLKFSTAGLQALLDKIAALVN